MIKLQFKSDENRDLNILFLGAHCDDIEIGCGGTILTLLDKYNIGKIVWVVFCSNEIRKKEAEVSAGHFLENVENKKIRVMNCRDGFLPDVWSEVKEEFESVKREFNPDLIFTHARKDRHQDHRIVSDLTWSTFRNHMILEYEIPKYDGDLGRPNFFLPMNSEIVEKKNRIILESFESQKNKHWFDSTLLTSLMRIRGVECAAEYGFAEAFYGRKFCI